jgi:hypothetical protein
LLDNNLLHLLLNCHDSSWDFVNALILATCAEFPQVSTFVPRPPILPYPAAFCATGCCAAPSWLKTTRKVLSGHSRAAGRPIVPTT